MLLFVAKLLTAGVRRRMDIGLAQLGQPDDDLGPMGGGAPEAVHENDRRFVGHVDHSCRLRCRPGSGPRSRRNLEVSINREAKLPADRPITILCGLTS